MSDTTLGATAAAVEVSARLDAAVQAATRSMAEFTTLTQLQQRYVQKSTVLQSALNGVLQGSISLADTMVRKLAGTLAVVQAALEHLMQGRTTLVIAHRLSTIERADRIVVLSHGKIMETGSHQQLLDANGAY
ncbi:MAG: hypothetical protein RR704_16135, partial [Stenotrophomonas sp.]